MIPVERVSPVVAGTAGMSAVYLPPLCAEIPAVVEHKMQLLLDQEEAPLVTILPPASSLSVGTRADDRMILAFDPSLVSVLGVRYAAQVACDPYLYGIVNTLRCGFRHGYAP